MGENRYYISTFSWTAVAKILNAVVGFFSVPLLLGLFGKAEYGILGIATACNGYMHLLDLGMNTGAVKFYSSWKAEGKRDTLLRVAHSNLSFYAMIAAVNALLLILLAYFGEGLFAISHSQFEMLRSCLLVIAIFSLFSWLTTAFNQLLIADRQMDFTMQMQSLQAVLKAALIAATLILKLDLIWYFSLLTALTAALILPYAFRCRKQSLIDSFRFGWHWDEFKQVFTFSLSIFALSLFQMTATQTRPIVLSIFGENGADLVADFNILAVIPSLIISIGSSFSTIFLPHAAELVAKNDQEGIQEFCYKWTRYTSILANLLCMPFILCAHEVLTAYVGAEYTGLAQWLIIWCLTVLVQVHTTPANSLVIAYGRTRQLVVTTAIACIISIVINIVLCRQVGVGSAIIGYFVYVIIVIGLYYLYYYRKLLGLSRAKMAWKFLEPTLIGAGAVIMLSFVANPFSTELFGGMNERLAMVLVCILKSLVWLIIFLRCSVRNGELKELKRK